MRHFLLPGIALLAATSANAAITYVDGVAIAGDATDLPGQSSAFAGNRLSFGSGLFRDASANSFQERFATDLTHSLASGWWAWRRAGAGWLLILVQWRGEPRLPLPPRPF